MTCLSKTYEYKNKKQVSSKFGGKMFYLFFTDGEKSYKTCVADTFRNWSNWSKFVKNAIRGDIVKGLRVKEKNLLDADCKPIYVGNPNR